MVVIAIMLRMAMVLYHAHYRTCPVFGLVCNTQKSADELIELFIGMGIWYANGSNTCNVCAWLSKHCCRIRSGQPSMDIA